MCGGAASSGSRQRWGSPAPGASVCPTAEAPPLILIGRGTIGFKLYFSACVERDRQLVAVGERVRRLRESRGYSQEDFAAKSGLDRAYYGGVERGERNVSARNLIRIASTLGVEVGELFPPVGDL